MSIVRENKSWQKSRAPPGPGILGGGVMSIGVGPPAQPVVEYNLCVFTYKVIDTIKQGGLLRLVMFNLWDKLFYKVLTLLISHFLDAHLMPIFFHIKVFFVWISEHFMYTLKTIIIKRCLTFNDLVIFFRKVFNVKYSFI